MPSLKSIAQHGLKRLNLYERAKASLLYEAYWRVADRKVIDLRNREIAFYRDVLRGFHPGDLVFDIGANEGSKTEIFLKLGAKVVAVEPDEAGQRTLHNKFQKLRIAKKPIWIEGMAVSDKRGSGTFWIHEAGSAKNTLNDKWVKALSTDDERFGEYIEFKYRQRVETATLDDLIRVYGVPFFIKIDVEGSEQAVIAGLQQRVPYLSFEVNLPEFKGEGMTCIDLLENLAPGGRFNYIADSEPQLLKEDWVPASSARQILGECSAKSVDVFWRTLDL